MKVELTRNERDTLSLAFRRGAVTQAQLAAHLEITQQSASRILLHLAELGMMRSGERVKHGPRGYPSKTFGLTPDYQLSAGVSVAAGAIAILLSDFAGNTVAVERVPCATSDLAATTAILGCHLEALCKTCGNSRPLAGMGLAVSGSLMQPGTFNTPYGMDQWAGIDLEHHFSSHLGLPVYADNDGNAAAFAEALRGVGQRFASFAYLYIAAGVGGGLVLDRTVWRGQHGNAGEFAGGLQPTLDVFPSLEVLRIELATDGHAYENIDTMLTALDLKWPAITRWIAKISHSLSVIASNAAGILDIEAVVLGGRMPRALAEVVIPHIRFFDQHRRLVARPVPVVIPAEGPAETAAAGAAIFPLKQQFHDS